MAKVGTTRYVSFLYTRLITPPSLPSLDTTSKHHRPPSPPSVGFSPPLYINIPRPRLRLGVNLAEAHESQNDHSGSRGRFAISAIWREDGMDGVTYIRWPPTSACRYYGGFWRTREDRMKARSSPVGLPKAGWAYGPVLVHASMPVRLSSLGRLWNLAVFDST